MNRYFAPAAVRSLMAPVLYFGLVCLLLTLLWEAYKLLSVPPQGIFLIGTQAAPEPGWLCQALGLCELRLPVRADDRSMPHVWDIAQALFSPIRRGDDTILLTVLWQASLYTLLTASLGFALGTLGGFGLGVLFAHSPFLTRGALPYVVASQTVPLIAIAPIVVIWFGASIRSVAIIAAYLTFFPVTINTLRGLLSPDPTALELMRTYAASSWKILWKVRVPSALPLIFTALKISATASVVGAIIGELPASVARGLGRVILNFNQYYATGPERLWCAILFASLTGMVFFLIVTAVERMALGQRQLSASAAG